MNWLEPVIMALGCPRCGAVPGKLCHAGNKKRSFALTHLSRFGASLCGCQPETRNDYREVERILRASALEEKAGTGNE